VENPAALTAANPDMPILYDVVDVEERLGHGASDTVTEAGPSDSNEETAS